MQHNFTPIPVDELFRIILNNEKNGHILGIPLSMFYRPSKPNPLAISRYGKLLETPLGVAAGPHTQLSQNIVAAWLCGARYIELKTIQTLDELHISKPCIDMQDEGYNCEWSQELKIEQSFGQYLDAWILLHVLKHKFEGSFTEAGFIFNMSAGYNLEGIQQENVRWFLSKMQDCSSELEERKAKLRPLYPAIDEIPIPSRISDNITVSTMHGCPPDEIEKIGRYFIVEKKLNTTIKLNPTLLGKEVLTELLNKKLGFKTIVPDEAFEHDLKYADALPILKNLSDAARNCRVAFGIKLTNTLESLNNRKVFSPSEKMMYMSGRALHPISIALAAKLQTEFEGKLDISFSAGADCFNISDILACGLKPVTVCSDLLKPGGYARMKQYCENLEVVLKKHNATNLEQLIVAKAATEKDIQKAALKNLNTYAVQVPDNSAYHKNRFSEPSIKIKRILNAFDCIKAPCTDTCPTHQDIPQYIYHVSRGEFAEAYRVIRKDNPFPNVLGMVCDHLCQTRCTRVNYDTSLLIREIKRFASERGEKDFHEQQINENGLKAAVIGAGPAGLSFAYFLRIHGFQVDVFEMKNTAGGMVASVIPKFRLSNEAFEKDLENIQKLGVRIHYGTLVNRAEFERIRKEYPYIFVGVGAQKMKKLGIEGESATGVVHPLMFLQSVKEGKRPDLGRKTIVIGGGNTAIDIARTAQRLLGENGKVSLMYRRTIEEMPAQQEEIEALLGDGIEVMELVAPKKIITEGWFVRGISCIRMRLAEPDESGRRKPVEIPGSEFEISCDTIIPAIGQDVVMDFFDKKMLQINPETGETAIDNIFSGGDAVQSSGNIIKAVADGKKAAFTVLKKEDIPNLFENQSFTKDVDFIELMEKRSRRTTSINTNERLFKQLDKSLTHTPESLTEPEIMQEASRCLYCDELCNICVTVCPNRANIFYQTKPASYKVFRKEANGIQTSTLEITQKIQVLNLRDFCNECGNCTTFCPTSGSPYRDKPGLFLNFNAFQNADAGYYFDKNNNTVLGKTKENKFGLKFSEKNLHYSFENIEIVLDAETLEIVSPDSTMLPEGFTTEKAIEMKLIREAFAQTFGV